MPFWAVWKIVCFGRWCRYQYHQCKFEAWCFDHYCQENEHCQGPESGTHKWLSGLTLLHLLTGRHGCILTWYDTAQYSLPYIGVALDFCGLEINPTFLMLVCAVLQAVSCNMQHTPWQWNVSAHESMGMPLSDNCSVLLQAYLLILMLVLEFQDLLKLHTIQPCNQSQYCCSLSGSAIYAVPMRTHVHMHIHATWVSTATQLPYKMPY